MGGEGDGDEDGSGVDEDGSGGNSPSRQGARTELLSPNLDFGAAAARNFSGSLVNIFRVYSAGAIYGRNGSSRRFPRPSRHTSARPDFNLDQPTC